MRLDYPFFSLMAIVIGILVAPVVRAEIFPLNSVRMTDGGYEAILDVRPAEICETASLPGARCLPAGDFLRPDRRLVNFDALLWLWGASGLTGGEHVLVVGEKHDDVAFVAGLLMLSGQASISMFTGPLSHANLEPGEPRSSTREVVFQAPMRSELVMLTSELRQMMENQIAQRIVDGRTEAEYEGWNSRATRGGHIPGAVRLGDMPDKNVKSTAIFYGHDTYDGLVAWSGLVAQKQIPRIYLDGWVAWAADANLPIESNGDFQTAGPAVVPLWKWVVIASLAILLVLAGGLWLRYTLLNRRKSS